MERNKGDISDIPWKKGFVTTRLQELYLVELSNKSEDVVHTSESRTSANTKFMRHLMKA